MVVKNRIRKLCMLIVIVFTALSLVNPTSVLKANNEKSGIQLIKKDEDGKSAVIYADMSGVNSQITITSVTGPENETLDINTLNYVVTENGNYSFTVNFSDENTAYSEDLTIEIDSIVKAEASAETEADQEDTMESNVLTKENDILSEPETLPETMSIKEVEERKKLEYKSVTTPIIVNAYKEGTSTILSDHIEFQGGKIEKDNISNLEVGGNSYVFVNAELHTKSSGMTQKYKISYLEDIQGKLYYTLDGGSEIDDMEIAMQAPADAEIIFVYTLSNEKNAIAIDSLKGTSVSFTSGVTNNKAKYGETVIFNLDYSIDFYTSSTADKTAIGAEIDGIVLKKESTDEKQRRIVYSFVMPNNAITIRIIGDQDTATTRTVGVLDTTAAKQNNEFNENYLKSINSSVSPAIEYGTKSGEIANKLQSGTGVDTELYVGESMNIQKTATGQYKVGNVLKFEYNMGRYKGPVDTIGYVWYPAANLVYEYYTPGQSYGKGKTVNEPITLWDPQWRKGTEYTQTASDGTMFKIVVKANKDISTTYYENYTVEITVTGATRDFFIRTDSTSTAQSPSYIRNKVGISEGSYEIDGVEYLDTSLLQRSDESQGTNNQLSRVQFGSILLDKFAGKYSNTVDGLNANQKGFEVKITPQWGYSYPVIEGYETTGLVSTSKPLEIRFNDKNKGFSSFNTSYKTRTDISPFQYMVYIDVNDRHTYRALDIKSQKIEVHVKDISSGTTETYDLIENKKYIVSREIPKSTDGSYFKEYKFTIQSNSNPFISDYSTVLDEDEVNPGDEIDFGDYFRQKTEYLEAKQKAGTLSKDEEDMLTIIMWSSDYTLTIEPIFETGISAGIRVPVYVNKYLQDITKDSTTYLTTPSDKKTIETTFGSNVFIVNYSKIFKAASSSPYSYLINEDTSEKDMKEVTSADEEIAKLKYDRILNITYDLGSDITDDQILNVFKDDHNYTTTSNPDSAGNTAEIKYPDEVQAPKGKAFVKWKIYTLDDSGNWVIPEDTAKKELTKGDAKDKTYIFESGTGKQNQSIKLEAVWRDIQPVEYISIPKQVTLTEGSTATKTEDSAGAKVKLSYIDVDKSGRKINIDILKSFELSNKENSSEKITVLPYDTSGSRLDEESFSKQSNYVKVGQMDGTNTELSLYFETPLRKDMKVYERIFDNAGSVLFYISFSS